MNGSLQTGIMPNRAVKVAQPRPRIERYINEGSALGWRDIEGGGRWLRASLGADGVTLVMPSYREGNLPLDAATCRELAAALRRWATQLERKKS